jgi:hypothetical protein
MTMNAIPWYKSPVYIGAVITILSTLLSLLPKVAAALGLTDPDAISTTVNSGFQVIALIAGVFTAVKRQTSTIQPLTLTKQAASDKTAEIQASPMSVPTSQPPTQDIKQKGFAKLSVLNALSIFCAVALLSMTVIVGCATPPTAVIATACGSGPVSQFGIERCAKGTVDVYGVYQKRGLELLQDPNTPDDVKNLVKQIDAKASPIAHDILITAAAYVSAKTAGAKPGDPTLAGPEAHLMNLQAQLQHSVTDLQTAVAGGAK